MQNYTPNRLWKPALYALAVLTCLRVWLGPTQILPQAEAQIPDAGLQRKLLLEEVQRTNELLIEIKQLLTDHTFNVRIAGADNPLERLRTDR